MESAYETATIRTSSVRQSSGDDRPDSGFNLPKQHSEQSVGTRESAPEVKQPSSITVNIARFLAVAIVAYYLGKVYINSQPDAAVKFDPKANYPAATSFSFLTWKAPLSNILEVTNETGWELVDVEITTTVKFNNGVEQSDKHFLGCWPRGGKVALDIDYNGKKWWDARIERVVLNGEAIATHGSHSPSSKVRLDSVASFNWTQRRSGDR